MAKVIVAPQSCSITIVDGEATLQAYYSVSTTEYPDMVSSQKGLSFTLSPTTLSDVIEEMNEAINEAEGIEE